MTWLAVALCLLVSFVFSGIEAGILSVNRVRLRHRVDELRDRAAIRLDRLLRDPERLLVTVLVVTNLMNIFAITLTAQEFVAWCGVWGYPAALRRFCRSIFSGWNCCRNRSFAAFPTARWPR